MGEDKMLSFVLAALIGVAAARPQAVLPAGLSAAACPNYPFCGAQSPADFPVAVVNGEPIAPTLNKPHSTSKASSSLPLLTSPSLLSIAKMLPLDTTPSLPRLSSTGSSSRRSRPPDILVACKAALGASKSYNLMFSCDSSILTQFDSLQIYAIVPAK